MKTSNNSIKAFLREIAVVVIGILVALFINNWNEDLKNKRFIKKTLYAIGEEIAYSKKDIEEILPKHYKTINALYASQDNTEESVRDVFMNIDGFQVPEIKNIGLRFFISNNAELVDYQLISDLSEIEFITKGFELKFSKLSDLVYAQMDSTEGIYKNRIAELLVELTDSEEDLVELYEVFLSAYEVSLQKSAQQ